MPAAANSSGMVDVPPLSAAAKRRLLADLKRLEQEPIPLANARPCSDSDLSLWDGVIGCEMDVTHMGTVTVPLHFLIDFPQDYPGSAPSIGFSFEFEYNSGASYTKQDGRLKGKKVICLDVLGNFGHVHTEWKGTVGSGWSPAYTVSTLLIQLQSVLCDLGSSQSQRERDVTYQTAVRFCERNPSSLLQILDEEEVREKRTSKRREERLSRICQGDEELVQRVGAFACKTGIGGKDEQMELLLELLADIASGASGGSQQGSAGAGGKPDEGRGGSASVNVAVGGRGPGPAVVDMNICCWSTGKLYTEALLGVGVSREHRNLGTAAELLSMEAFQGGLRQNTNKSAFEFFLPVWINEKHAAGSQKWREALLKSYSGIGQRVYETSDEDGAILEVFPRLVNQMVVEMMRPDAGKSEAIALFEALCNFWRTFRWLVDTRSTLRAKIGESLAKFVSDEQFRHKDRSPDIGALLVSYTVLQGYPSCPARKDFVSAYSDETSLRWVMWWQRSGTQPESGPVFQATKVSREILMFQMMVVDIVLGGDVAETLREMEASNCKLPARLERLQAQWRQRKDATKDWAAYFACIAAPQPRFQSVNAWISDCAKRASQKGPKYGGAKGAGKQHRGSGKGKGK